MKTPHTPRAALDVTPDDGAAPARPHRLTLQTSVRAGTQTWYGGYAKVSPTS